MMMCIGSVTDFEAQMLASVEHYSKWRSAEDLERAERSDTWLRARQCGDLGWDLGWGLGLCLRRVEPPLPYSHGRRFVPAWLAEERALCMAEGFGTTIDDTEAYQEHNTLGVVRVYSFETSTIARDP